MTRADVRTFAWMVPLALVLEISWTFWGTYLTYAIAETWVTEAPAATTVSSDETSGADTVQVENPYGIPHGIPSALETGAKIAIPLGIVLLVGFLSARNFQRHAGRRAAAVMFIALFIAKASVWVAFLRRNSNLIAQMTAKDRMANIADILIMAMVGAAFAWLATTLILRWRARG